ncbi:MAG: sulfatase [Planctomycetota bacterium]
MQRLLFVLAVFCSAVFCSILEIGRLNAADRPNVLIVTVDDMSCDSVGAFGCDLPGTTPNMDALAKTALRFSHAHVQVGNCMPSRNVMWSGRFPHNNGVEGFYQVKEPSYQVLCDYAQQAGYYTAIRHKISHSTPYNPYPWDLELDSAPDGSKRHMKNAASYGDSVRQAIAAAEQADKPFCVMVNISDPHKPFYSQVRNGKDPHVPSLIFQPEQITTPGFLPEDAAISQELALYYSSVRRADDCLGQVLQALRESGHEQKTFVMFLSDHGMPLPFAKTQLYHHSTRTPLMVRWPKVTKPDTIEENHMVSAVDFIPTLAEVMQFDVPTDLDGRSFAAVLRDETQADRNFIVKEYNENSGSKRNPMRAIETKDYLYLFNPWSNGKLIMATATNGTQTWKRMKSLASSDPKIAARVRLMEYREVEELYHVGSDPDCLVNLINDPEHELAAQKLRSQLATHMEKTKDPLRSIFDQRDDRQLLQQFMDEAQAQADERRKQRKAKQVKPKNESKPAVKKGKKFFTWNAVSRGSDILVTISYELPTTADEVALIVTLKSAKNKRLQRHQAEILGTGTKQFTFAMPDGETPASLKLAAYIGPDYQRNWQYENESVVKLIQSP